MYSVIYNVITREIDYVSKSQVSGAPSGFAIKYITEAEYAIIKPELANYVVQDEKDIVTKVKVKKMKKVRNIAPLPRETITR